MVAGVPADSPSVVGNAAVAIGYQGDKALLPEAYQQREMPSDRRPVTESVFHGPMAG